MWVAPLLLYLYHHHHNLRWPMTRSIHVFANDFSYTILVPFYIGDYCNLTGQCSCKSAVAGINCDHCQSGFFAMDSNPQSGCTNCFCSGHGKSGLCKDYLRAHLLSRQVRRLWGCTLWATSMVVGVSLWITQYVPVDDVYLLLIVWWLRK